MKKDMNPKGPRQRIVVHLTDACNWNCSYCEIPGWRKGNKKSTTIEKIDEYAAILKDAASPEDFGIAIQGGEPGLLRPKVLEHAIKAFSDYFVVLNTNGLVFEKHNMKKLYRHCGQINYHCTKEFDSSTVIEPVTFYDPRDIVDYITVVHARNIEHFAAFVENNAHLPRHKPKTYGPRNGTDLLLDDAGLEEFKRAVQLVPNIQERAYRDVTTKMAVPKDKLELLQRFCCLFYAPSPMFNFVDGTINRCCISVTTSAVDLTPENAALALSKKPESPFPMVIDETCKGCDKVPIGHDAGDARTYANFMLKAYDWSAKEELLGSKDYDRE